MTKIVGVTELQRRFRLIFDEVAQDHIAYILTRGSRPEAALISYEEFEQYQVWKELAREEALLVKFDRMRARLAEQNAAYSEENVAADIEDAIREVRQLETPD